MPNKTALLLPNALLVRYFPGGEINLVKKVETLLTAVSGSASALTRAIWAEASAMSPKSIDRRGGGVRDKRRAVISGEQFELNSQATFRKVRAMNDVVEGAVDDWLPALGLPAPPAAGVEDLKARPIRVAKFIDDATVRFFFPRRTLSLQQRMVKSLARRLRKRGAEILSVRSSIEG